ncbi:MAG: hypothetical protein ABI591_07485, partial [Kofleriaceae bacterium]
MRTFKIGDWEFWLAERNGKWSISVPDRGGMADSQPRIPAQLAWAEQQFATLPWLAQTWSTTWELRDLRARSRPTPDRARVETHSRARRARVQWCLVMMSRWFRHAL